MRELKKIEVVNKKLHEVKQEFLMLYSGEVEMVGNLEVGDQIRQTHSRFRKIDDFESYINSIDQDYDSDYSIFNGYIFKLDTPQFNKVNRSQYGNGCDFKHEIIEYRANNCFIPTKCFCFVKCINFLTGGDYKEQYKEVIRKEERRANIMTKAKIQPFCRANNNNLRYYDGEKVFPRSIPERNIALFSYNNHFCLICRSEILVLIKQLKN